MYVSNHIFEILSEDNSSYQSFCNSLEFTNTGAANVELTVTGSPIVLVPGARKAFSSAHPEVVIRTSFQVKFSGAGTKALTVVKELVSKA